MVNELPAALVQSVILIVGPETTSSRACPILQDSGYVVLSANDGSTAIRIVEQYKQSIDLIVAGSLDGDITASQVVERVLAKYPVAKVLYLYGAADDCLDLLKTQKSVLTGRFSPYALRRAVRSLLGPRGVVSTKSAAQSAAQQTVLIVEPDDKFRRLLDFRLATSGYLVRDASSSFGALQLVRKYHIDVLVVQLRAAEVSGADLAISYLEQNPLARVIFTLETLDKFQEKSPRCTAIRKPFTPEELAEKVSAVLSA